MGALTDRKIKAAAPGNHVDGDGLMLVVSASGSKSWVLRYQMNKKRRDMGLGAYPDIGLAKARELVGDYRKLIAVGVDPIADRTAKRAGEKPIPTFGDIAAKVIAHAQANSVNDKVQYQWRRHLGPAYCGDLIPRPVNEITTSDIAKQLAPVWKTKPEVARKLYTAIRRVFERARTTLRDEYAITMGDNPAAWADLVSLGFEKPEKLSRGHHPSLPYEKAAAFMADLRTRRGIAAKALELLILANVRTNSLLQAEWDEFDLQAKLWTIPVSHLKDQKFRTEPFRVPLSAPAVALLEELSTARTCDLVFASGKFKRDGTPIGLSNMAMGAVITRMNDDGKDLKWMDPIRKRQAVPHGFRATFRTWAEESTGFPHNTVEEAMGHSVGSESERAYRRTDVLQRRRELMDAWAGHLKQVDSNITRLDDHRRA